MVLVTRDIGAVLRDGTTLRSDIYYPDRSGSYPVLLSRTPYGKRRDEQHARQLAAAGYIVAVQDVRGRYSSDGEFRPLFGHGHCDDADGYDSVEWAAKLTGSSGDVGMFGSSYSAWTSWKAAGAAPPSLRCMYVSGMCVRMQDVEPIFRPGRRLQWYHSTIEPDLKRRTPGFPGPYSVDDAARVWEAERQRWLWLLPRSANADRLHPAIAEPFRRALLHPGEDTLALDGVHRRIDIPVLNRTGWYDRFIMAVDHFEAMAKEAPSEGTRKAQRLLVGPWGHTNLLSRVQGEMDFGPESEMSDEAIAVRWFDHWLKGRLNGVDEESRVRLFLMGVNKWIDMDVWPPATDSLVLFLSSDERANTPGGDGRLTLQMTQGQPFDGYRYDPKDPVPSLFLPDCQDGPRDQRVLDHRADVLVFQTAPLETPITVVGAPTVRMFASSSVVDTDFTVKLVDVAPDGLAISLCYGIVRARYRNSWENPEFLRPDEVTEFSITLNPTGNVFLPGHRVRLDISSSDFPNFERNLNTGGDGVSEAELVVASQRVFHTAQHPSRITLPVLPA